NATDPSGKWPRWLDRTVEAVADGARYVGGQVVSAARATAEFVFKSVQVAGQWIEARTVDVLNAGAGAVQWIVKKRGEAVAAIGDRLVEVGRAVAEEFGKAIDAFAAPIKKLWDLVDKVKDFAADAGRVITAVVNNPGRLVDNLLGGAKIGFQRFFDLE